MPCIFSSNKKNMTLYLILIIKIISFKTMKDLQWLQDEANQTPIVKVPLHFMFPPVQILSKELTRLNSNHQYRISYLGPRWDNSLLFHKKYSQGGAYDFQQKRVNKNNNFLHQSMTHNQFYKNEIYYRAFQGVNPTLNHQNELVFESRFESGNLDCVVKVSENEYDLFLRIDSNTRGNIFWYYFAVKNGKNNKIKFNICNLTKDRTHYNKGLNPFMFTSNTKQWSQEGMTNVTFQQKKLRYNFIYERMRVRNFYELSFQVEFKGEQEVKFAYCIPYTYSNLLSDLKSISDVAQVSTLGQTLTGINIPIVMVGSQTEENKKPVLMITGRIHPGQSNGSLIVSNLMKYLCYSPQARYLRQKVLTVIVPMINPDGVILGNSRTGASGKDLNRQFKTRNISIYPEIVLLKNLVQKITQTHMLDIYLDFHGHSRKRNIFMFGPAYNITQPQYYKCRVFPKILSTITSIFRYYGCNYDLPCDKKATARAVMLNQMMIPFVFTVETSLGFYYDNTQHKNIAFNQRKWEEIGEHMVLALSQYYQGVEQLQIYIQLKKKARKEQAKNKDSKPQLILNHKKGNREIKKDEKDIKIFKIFEQIKELQEKKAKESKKQKESEDDSDSYDSRQDLQKEKMHQFSQMVGEFIKEEKRRTSSYSQSTQQKEISKKNNGKKLKMILFKNRQDKNKEQELLFDFNQNNKTVQQKNEVFTSSRNKRAPSKQRDNSQIEMRKGLLSQQIKRNNNDTQQTKSIEANINPKIGYSYFQEQMNFFSVQKQVSNKLSIRMFNFEKVIQNPSSLRYYQQKDLQKMKEMFPGKYQKLYQDKKRIHSNNQIDQKHEKNEKISASHLDFIEESREEEIPTPRKKEQMSNTLKKHQTDDLKQKGRGRFPPSFYRIKYCHAQKKKFQANREHLILQQESSTYRRSGLKNVQRVSSFTAAGGRQYRIIKNDRKNDKSYGVISRNPLF